MKRTTGKAWRLGAALLMAATPSARAQPPRAPAGPLIPPAVIDETLEVDGESIAARRLRTRLAVPVSINAQGPFRFIVDSGADRSVIGSDLALRLGLPASGSVLLHSIAGSSRVDTVHIDRLGIGASEMTGIDAPALPESFIGAQGLIGIDALAEQRLMLDFDRKTITVEDSRKPVRSSIDEIIVTARRRHGQLIITQAFVGRTRILALIDTGSELTTGNSALQRRLFAGGRLPRATPVTLTGVTGESTKVDLATLREVRIGALRLQDVRIGFGDVATFALFGLHDQPALLLGTDLLEAFRRVSLDFGRRTVRFQLRR